MTVRATNGYVWPASHRAGSNSQALPMGARLRLKASKDLSGYHPELQKIFRAMQRYGLIVADNGSDMYISGDVRSALEQRHPESGVPLADRQRLRGDRARLARQRRPACPSPGSAVAVHVLAERRVRRRSSWAARRRTREDYVIEVGSAPGLSNLLVTLARARRRRSATVAPPGRYFARIRAQNRCGCGPASNEIVVTI